MSFFQELDDNISSWSKRRVCSAQAVVAASFSVRNIVKLQIFNRQNGCSVTAKHILLHLWINVCKSRTLAFAVTQICPDTTDCRLCTEEVAVQTSHSSVLLIH